MAASTMTAAAAARGFGDFQGGPLIHALGERGLGKGARFNRMMKES